MFFSIFVSGMFCLRMLAITSRDAAYVLPLACFVRTFAQVKIKTYRFASWGLVVRSMKFRWHWESLIATSSFATLLSLAFVPFSIWAITLFLLLVPLWILLSLRKGQHMIGDCHICMQPIQSFIQRQGACRIRLETTCDHLGKGEECLAISPQQLSLAAWVTLLKPGAGGWVYIVNILLVHLITASYDAMPTADP